MTWHSATGSIINPDGSVDLYLQAESPGKDKEANWLPAPKGKFVLVMRIYAPRANAAFDPGRHMDAAARETRAVGFLIARADFQEIGLD